MSEAAHNDPRVLFILAGYPGAGKTTLLCHALANRLPLFGREYDHLFQQTILPPNRQEEDVRAPLKLARGTWLHENHIGYLAQQEALPHHLVIHLDLYSVLLLAKDIVNLPAHLAPHVTRRIETFLDSGALTSLFRIFLSTTLFTRYDRIIINSLSQPWDVTAAQWLARDDKLQWSKTQEHIQFLRAHFFDDARLGQAIHSALHQGWAEAVRAFAPHRAIRSEIVNGEWRLHRVFEREAAAK